MSLPCGGGITPYLVNDSRTCLCDAEALAIIHDALQPVSLPAYFSAQEFLEELECRFTVVALRALAGVA